ncbi:MAG: hypothetical protein K6C34_03165 [Alphaproteobacteria bacterium]|nr:hypothetical protein [Alphaproteobacteria bacterium]
MFRKLNRKLKRSRGYVLILLAVALPVIFLGMQYILKSQDLSHNDTLKTGAAGAVGMAILDAYNPGVAWTKQQNVVYRAAAHALNDKTYSILKKMLISSSTLDGQIAINEGQISANNLAHVYAKMYHGGDIYSGSTLYSAQYYPVKDVVYKAPDDKALNGIVTYNAYKDSSTTLESNDDLSIEFDPTNNAIIGNCPSICRKVTVYPAECNADIILTIPTNATAPITNIAETYEKFLQTHFTHTRGIAVGVIPYSGKISVPPTRTAWTQKIPSYSYKTGEPRLKQCEVYASDGEIGGVIASNYYAWGPILTQNSENTDNENLIANSMSNYGIMSRLDDDSNYIDLLLTNEPSGSFRQMNMQPCYLGYCNLLGDACEETCPTYQPNPFFMQELTDDVLGVAYDLSLFQAINDSYNKSNFLFLPAYWACNLLSNWTAHPGREATKELMSHATRDNKLKVVILVVNAPNNFEPRELTYLGFNNDAAELPMSESDVIDFSQNMRQGTEGIITYSGNGSIDPETKEFVCDGMGYLKFPRKGLVKLVVEKATFAFDGENSGRHNISGSQTFIFSGPTLPKDGTTGYGTQYNSTQGINFGGNLSKKKVKYKLENAKITACNLKGQVLRDYAGQYGRELSHVRPLILNDGTPAKRSGTNPYTVYETFGITGSGNLNSVSGLRDKVQKFMDPCMSIANNPYYSNAKERGEYNEQTLQYVVNGLAETRYYLYFYCAILTDNNNNLNITHYLYDSFFGNIYENYFTSDSVYNGWRWRELESDSYWNRTNSGITHNLVSITSSVDSRKLGTYIYIGPNKRFAVIKLGTNTDIYQNACVFLENNWICFNGDGTLEVTVESTGNNSVVTFYDDNRVTPEDITSNITFTNLTTNKDLCATPNNTYTISDRQTFYIDASQLQGDDINGYSVAFNMENISIVSAEVTNRPYTIYKSKVSLSGNTVISTYHPENFKIKVRPTKESSISITDIETGEEKKYGIPTGSSKELTFDYLSSYQITNTGSDKENDYKDDRGRKGHKGKASATFNHAAPKDKFKISALTDAKITGGKVTDREIRWVVVQNHDFYSGEYTKGRFDEGVTFGGMTRVWGASTDHRETWKNQTFLSAKDGDGDCGAVLSCYCSDKNRFAYITFGFGGETLKGKLQFCWYSNGYDSGKAVYGGIVCVPGKPNWLNNNDEAYGDKDDANRYNYGEHNDDNAHLVTRTDFPDNTGVSFGVDDRRYDKNVYLYWWRLSDIGTKTISDLKAGSACSFVGAGKVKLTVQSTLKPKVKLKETGDEYTINGETEISISANKFKKNSTPEADGHYNYTLSFSLTDAEIVSNSLAQTSSHVGIWYHKITAPTYSAYVDFSQKGAPAIVNNDWLSFDYKTAGVIWNEKKYYWVVYKNRNYGSGYNDFYNNGYPTTKLDGFFQLDSEVIHEIDTSVTSPYRVGGLYRLFWDNSKFSQNRFWCDVHSINNDNPPSFLYAGYVLPANYALLNYEISKEHSYVNPQTALDNVASEACDKLKTLADKVYLIKYGTDNDSLNSCVEEQNGKIYDNVNSASQLEDALNKIAADIKNAKINDTAIYNDSKIVVETTNGKEISEPVSSEEGDETPTVVVPIEPDPQLTINVPINNEPDVLNVVVPIEPDSHVLTINLPLQ